MKRLSKPMAATLCALALSACPHVASAQSDPPAPGVSPWKVNHVNAEDLVSYDKVLVVPGVTLSFLAEGRVTARAQSGFLSGGNSSALQAVSFKVEGLSKELLQHLAREAERDLIERLRAAGYKVMTYADIKDRPYVQAWPRVPDAVKGPVPVTENGITHWVAAPSDEQHFRLGLTGWWELLHSGGKPVITDATVVTAHYRFNAPKVWAEGSRGTRNATATVNTHPGMDFITASVNWTGKPVSRMMRGAPGTHLERQVDSVSDNVGTLAQTADNTPTAANTTSSVLSGLFGSGNVQRGSVVYSFKIDPAAYEAGVMGAVRAFNAQVAKAPAGGS